MTKFWKAVGVMDSQILETGVSSCRRYAKAQHKVSDLRRNWDRQGFYEEAERTSPNLSRTN